MPIRAENKKRYPSNWAEISRRIRYERANNACEDCGVKNYELGGRDENGKWHRARVLDCSRTLPIPGTWSWCDGGLNLRIVRIVLTVAHVDHTPENCADDNLKALCQRCHNRYDAAHRRQGIRERALANQGKLALELPA